MFTPLKTILVTTLIACTFSLIHCPVGYGCDQPDIVADYVATLPKLKIHHQEDLTVEDKAQMITQYLCQFMPSKVEVYEGQKELQTKIESLIDQEKSLNFLLPGFPFKSTNHEKKCLSAHVDMGEYFSLLTLSTLVSNIQSLYPLVHCTILSDGLGYHTDGDAPYSDILIYHEEMGKIARCLRWTFLCIVGNERFADILR